MRMYDLIMKKRNGGVLSKEEIDFMIKGYTCGEIPDYQMSAMMMAIYFVGMNEEETLFLTMAMAKSGIKYLRRDGTPSCTMKGTRWAGAFHYPRMLFNLIRLMQEELAK